MLELAIGILGLGLGAVEFYVWHSEILWHRSEPKRDPRNGI
jgi:hypothetical protein